MACVNKFVSLSFAFKYKKRLWIGLYLNNYKLLMTVLLFSSCTGTRKIRRRFFWELPCSCDIGSCWSVPIRPRAHRVCVLAAVIYEDGLLSPMNYYHQWRWTTIANRGKFFKSPWLQLTSSVGRSTLPYSASRMDQDVFLSSQNYLPQAAIRAYFIAMPVK